MKAERSPSAVEIGILRDLLVSVCEEMGTTLQRTAYSVNIKERRDYSTAIFDERGRCLVCGDHMPVHLGSLPMAVESLLAMLSLGDGDVGMANDPYHGGTHLPDITLVEPVPLRSGGRLYVACRAHHSDVGGMTPGSMPLASEIFQEGLRIPPVRFVRRGKVNEGVLAILLGNVRTPEERRGDLTAQRAALTRGVCRLLDLERRAGPSFERQLPYLIAYAARATHALIREIPPGRHSFEDVLDDDGRSVQPIPIRVDVTKPGGNQLIVDFRRSASQVDGSVNCGRAVTISAVAYVLRCLLRADVPMNAGTLDRVRVLTRPGSVVDALPPAAVCGGNVETSQRIVDVLLGALSKAMPHLIPAASQGTMNNVALGGQLSDGTSFAYYETVAGGGGASERSVGMHAVHSHMTNSLNTPIETLEQIYPLRVTRYEIRRGSGGRGRRRGGEGVVREIQLLAPATVTVQSDRRRFAPYGLHGGEAGGRGSNTVIPARAGPEGLRVRLPGKVTLTLHAGDRLRIETPGGGGYGRARRRRKAARL